MTLLRDYTIGSTQQMEQKNPSFSLVPPPPIGVFTSSYVNETLFSTNSRRATSLP
jgi:hypothetical protein